MGSFKPNSVKVVRRLGLNVVAGALCLWGSAVLMAARAQQSPGVSSGPTPAPVNRPLKQLVSIALRADGGATTLHAYSFGDAYAIDSAKLHFIARRRGTANAPSVELKANVGTAAFVTPDPRISRSGKGYDEYSIPVRFERSPGMDGLYDVELRADPGFARTASVTLELGDPNRQRAQWHAVFWWPPASAEAGLADLRRRIAGKDTYWYGGVALGCATWSSGFGPNVPVRVLRIERETGQVALLGTGSTMLWGNGPSFYSFDPLRIILEEPHATPLFFGSGGWGGAAADKKSACPAIVLADWQIESILSTDPPPLGIGRKPVAVGMSRDQVAWTAGYPTGFDNVATMQRANSWSYEGGPKNSQAFEFKNDRVVSIFR